jgi:hypothetical protein
VSARSREEMQGTEETGRRSGLVAYNCKFVGVGLGPQSRVPQGAAQRDSADWEVA